MPRKCESGAVHTTYGDIRECRYCQSNGHAAQVHARHGNDEPVDPQPAQQQAAPPPPKAKRP